MKALSSTSIRRALLGTTTALALIAGAAQAHAACGFERDALGAAVAVGGGAAIADGAMLGGGTFAPVLGPATGILAFGLYNNYCTTGSMFTAAPVTIVQVESGAGYRVAFADMSQITPEPKYAAVSTNLGDVRWAELVASFKQATETQYAAVR